MHPPDEIPASRPRLTAARLTVVIIFVLAVATLLGIYLNGYLATDWNAVRLTPTFMWLHGAAPFPGPGEAPFTTWIYGPITLIIFAPAALAPDTFSALLLAFAVNFGLALLPLVFVLRTLGRNDDRVIQVNALLLTLALWPACNFVYEQADNTAIAFGLVSVGLLSRRHLPGRRGLWLLAFAGGLALWSKATELGPVLGQLALIGLRGGTRAALRQVLRLAVAGGACGIIFIFASGAEGLVYNVFVIPSRIPWSNLGTKIGLYSYLPHELAYVILPFGLFLTRWKRFLSEPGPAQTAWCFFLLSLPFNIAGFATIGGTINSLHGCVYILPWLALVLAQHRFWLSPLLITIALTLQYIPFSHKSFSLADTRDSLAQGKKLAEACPGQIYFPWNPLITFYSEKKFYHSDDGILTRALTGEMIDHNALYAGLPAHFNWIAYPGGVRNTHLETLLPPTRAYYHFHGWTLVSANGLLPEAFSPVPSPGHPAQATP